MNIDGNGSIYIQRWMNGEWIDRLYGWTDEQTDTEAMIITTLRLNITKLPGVCTASAHDVELKSSSVLPCHTH